MSTIRQRTCDKNKGYTENLCNKIIFNKKVSANDEYVWVFMSQTARGYRNQACSFPKHYFCSKECMDYFNTYNRCHRCNQQGKGVYVEELGYSLCSNRGDFHPPCIAKYRLEQRFKKDYESRGFYKIDNKLKDILLDGWDELKQLMGENGNKISNAMLLDLHILTSCYEVRERERETETEQKKEKEQRDQEIFIQQCATISKELI
jgi:hypothetical protein